MTKLHCKLNIFSRSMHISQIITGFLMLQKAGIIDLEINFSPKDVSAYPFADMAEAIINHKIKIAYDMLDGYNFEKLKVEEYLNKIDFYFKRSFNQDYHKDFINASKILPLGFNYGVTAPNNVIDNINFETPKIFIKSVAKNIFNKFCYTEDFEDIPHKSDDTKILFTARVYNPDENNINNDENLKEERKFINNMRIECIKKLRKEFGKNFIGGISSDDYAVEHYSDCIIDSSLTNRKSFMKLIKDSGICIATMGLHQSNGWKLAEYIAAGKAIVSEKLYYDVPGNFEVKRNYLDFETADECVEQTAKLVANPDTAYSMKVNNYNYYHNFLRPDRLIFNSLIQALEKFN